MSDTQSHDERKEESDDSMNDDSMERGVRQSLESLHPNPSSLKDDYQYHHDEIEHLNVQLSPREVSSRSRSAKCCDCLSGKPESRSTRFRIQTRRVLNLLNLSPRRKALLLDRYVSLVERYGDVRRRYTRTYNSVRFVTTLCGIMTPALLSLQPLWGSTDTENPIYWSSFGTSFTLALLNAWMSLYKVDKKFMSSTRAHISLESEGWQYFGLVGAYGGSEMDPNPTHASMFQKFMDRIESIRNNEAKLD